jgi:cardiolipin synthase A/B
MAALCWVLAAGCAQLPDAGLATEHKVSQVEIESARGPLSLKRVASILARLKGGGEELDILQQHVALEQAIVGTPLTGTTGGFFGAKRV